MESDSILLCILIINTFNCSRKCSGQFQVAKADQGDDQKRAEESEKGDDDEEHSEMGGGDNSEEHGSGWSSGESDAESDRESDEYVDEEIISPALCVIHFLSVKLCMTVDDIAMKTNNYKTILTCHFSDVYMSSVWIMASSVLFS